ncbi:MAG: DUF1854 domain-containing protein [Dechloromonas sp.]|nr:DUF1854 domain-containing protein [Dechloromonas sp.]
MTTPAFHLWRDSYGRLVLIDQNGEDHAGVVPVRAFPIGAPDDGIALVNLEGHEVGWVNRIADLPPEIGRLVEEELASREFMPEIEKIFQVSSFACPSTWRVGTNRGKAILILKGEEDIRRLSQTRLLIADTQGIHFLVRDIGTLDRHSRKLLDRFL